MIAACTAFGGFLPRKTVAVRDEFRRAGRRTYRRELHEVLVLSAVENVSGFDFEASSFHDHTDAR